VDISWVDRGSVIVSVGRWPRRKKLRVAGEYLLARDPDFLIYARYITHWEDGTAISDEEQADVLDRVVDEAAKRGWKFEIEW
jgi:Immunity protein 74